MVLTELGVEVLVAIVKEPVEEGPQLAGCR